jgi:hypothetical protein
MTVKSCYLILYVGAYYLNFVTKNSDTKLMALVRWECKRRISRRHRYSPFKKEGSLHTGRGPEVVYAELLHY